VEAAAFLQKRGFTVEQFDQLNQERKAAVGQSGEDSAGPKTASLEKPEESIAKRLCSTLMQKTSLEEAALKRLLQTGEELDVATHLIKMLTECVKNRDRFYETLISAEKVSDKFLPLNVRQIFIPKQQTLSHHFALNS
jgi:hypothetical protein